MSNPDPCKECENCLKGKVCTFNVPGNCGFCGLPENRGNINERCHCD